jgi:SAM-dependent methyltransferase
MDDISAFNQSRWDELVRRGVMYGRPALDHTPESARAFLDPYGLLGDVHGLEVLCLASAGGQQSAAFAVLGAQVHVIDLSPAMLAGDHQAAAHYGLPIDVQQGDMRDLSRYADQSFDLVWQPYSINFIPDPRPVFTEVARILRTGGRYFLQFHNPFLIGMTEESWRDAGYALGLPYLDGAEIEEPIWDFEDEQGNPVRIEGPRSFRHTLSAVLNTLIGHGFELRGLWEETSQDAGAPPGSWEHFMRVAPPWISMWWGFPKAQ